jgi:hypothetical protein
MPDADRPTGQQIIEALDALDLGSLTIEDIRNIKNKVLKEAILRELTKGISVEPQAQHTSHNIVIHGSHGQHSQHSQVIA